MKVARRKWWGTRYKDFEKELVQVKRFRADGTPTPRRGSSMSKPTLSKNLDSLLDAGILRREQLWGPRSEGVYVHVLAEAGSSLRLRAWAELTLDRLGRPRAGMPESDVRQAVRALRIKKSLGDQVLTRMLHRMALAGVRATEPDFREVMETYALSPELMANLSRAVAELYERFVEAARNLG